MPGARAIRVAPGRTRATTLSGRSRFRNHLRLDAVAEDGPLRRHRGEAVLPRSNDGYAPGVGCGPTGGRPCREPRSLPSPGEACCSSPPRSVPRRTRPWPPGSPRSTRRCRRSSRTGTARHRRRHRGQGRARVREGLRLPRLRPEAALHGEDDRADRLQHQALHGGRRGAPGRGRQARLGQAGAAVRARASASTTTRSTTRSRSATCSSHRTGITRHDSIWYKSDFTRQELFERLRYLEPTQPPRSTSSTTT